MKKLNRRDFIKGSLAGAAGVGIYNSLAATTWSQVIGANGDIRVAVAGVRGKGVAHIEMFRKIPGVRVVALCDPDRDILASQVKSFTDRQEKIDAYTDIRRLLEDKNIDAIAIATPNHWHALMAIWACQAGKDVYVEKPVSHNIWEGRKIVEAARKYNRIVQTGTQFRSDEGYRQALEYINQGNIGKIVLARGFCYKPRSSIGKVRGPQPIPAVVDYDIWTGPAPLEPLRRTQLHYDWHWVWQTGNGDIGNQGIHQMDLCRWAIGQNQLAPRVMSIGGRFGYDDDGVTPNTQIAILDYQPVPIIFEVRGLPRKKDDPAMDNYRGVRIGQVIQCEGGYLAAGEGGGWIYDNEYKRVKQFVQHGPKEHQANFIQAVRSRKVSDLTADILEGHLSSALCHMANISHRLGQLSTPDEIAQAISDLPGAQDTWERFKDHLFANWVDLTRDLAVLGPSLTMDPQTERFVGEGEYSLTCFANEMLTRDYRRPFVVPEQV